MAGWKKKSRYSEETPWFPEYYIGWIGIRKCGQKTYNKEFSVHFHGKNSLHEQNDQSFALWFGSKTH